MLDSVVVARYRRVHSMSRQEHVLLATCFVRADLLFLFRVASILDTRRGAADGRAGLDGLPRCHFFVWGQATDSPRARLRIERGGMCEGGAVLHVLLPAACLGLGGSLVLLTSQLPNPNPNLNPQSSTTFQLFSLHSIYTVLYLDFDRFPDSSDSRTTSGYAYLCLLDPKNQKSRNLFSQRQATSVCGRTLTVV